MYPIRTTVFLKDFEIHTTPLEKILIEPSSIKVFLDDISEQRYKITFSPFQAVNITAIDCTSALDFYNDYSFRDGRYHRHILVMEDSDFIKSLDESTTNRNLLKLSKHFVLPLQEIIIEVVAYDIRIEPYNCDD